MEFYSDNPILKEWRRKKEKGSEAGAGGPCKAPKKRRSNQSKAYLIHASASASIVSGSLLCSVALGLGSSFTHRSFRLPRADIRRGMTLPGSVRGVIDPF